MKILLPLLLLATLGMLATLPHIANADDNGQNDHQTGQGTNHEGLRIRLHVRLTGDQQVPAVNTAAFGFAEVQLSEDNNALAFEVVAWKIANVIASNTLVGP